MNAIEPQSLRARAYEAIKDRIITLQYRPGEYLNEALVSAQLGIGRTPVHQALDRLMHEGMVEVMPRKGVVVKPVSLDDVLELVDARLVNEPFCARLAAERVTSEDLTAMTDVLDRSAEAAQRSDLRALMKLDREFHACISAAARNRILADFVRTLHDRSMRIWFITLSDHAHSTEVRTQHHGIYEAIAAHDGDLADERSRAHIEAFRKRLMAAI